MVIHMPKPRPVAAGFWTFCDQTGDLRHVDAHADSTVCTRWPLLDRWHRNLIERGVDWLLNAAGAGRERLDNALRVPYPGSRLDRLPAVQSNFWYRLLHGLSGGATVEAYLGNGKAGLGGLTIDDSQNNNLIQGWPGGRGGNAGGRGQGPGGGSGGARSQNHHFVTEQGGRGGGYSQAAGGSVVPPEWVFAALITNRYARDTLGMGGGGGGGGSNNVGGQGGNARIRISVGDLPLAGLSSSDGNLSGSSGENGGRRDGGAGGGSGGLFLAIAYRRLTIPSGIQIRAAGGGGGRGGENADGGGSGGSGRVISCYGDSVDINTRAISNAVTTTYHLLPSLPLGQVHVS